MWRQTYKCIAMKWCQCFVPMCRSEFSYFVMLMNLRVSQLWQPPRERFIEKRVNSNKSLACSMIYDNSLLLLLQQIPSFTKPFASTHTLLDAALFHTEHRFTLLTAKNANNWPFHSKKAIFSTQKKRHLLLLRWKINFVFLLFEFFFSIFLLLKFEMSMMQLDIATVKLQSPVNCRGAKLCAIRTISTFSCKILEKSSENMLCLAHDILQYSFFVCSSCDLVFESLLLFFLYPFHITSRSTQI